MVTLSCAYCNLLLSLTVTSCAEPFKWLGVCNLAWVLGLGLSGLGLLGRLKGAVAGRITLLELALRDHVLIYSICFGLQVVLVEVRWRQSIGDISIIRSPKAYTLILTGRGRGLAHRSSASSSEPLCSNFDLHVLIRRGRGRCH